MRQTEGRVFERMGRLLPYPGADNLYRNLLLAIAKRLSSDPGNGLAEAAHD